MPNDRKDWAPSGSEIKAYAAAMSEISDRLRPFSPEARLVMISGQLGRVLCELGPTPDRMSAVAMLGTAIEMVLDMVNHTFPPAPDEEQTPYRAN